MFTRPLRMHLVHLGKSDLPKTNGAAIHHTDFVYPWGWVEVRVCVLWDGI